MTLYYFLATALPPLDINTPPEISLQDFLALCKENLNRKDVVQVKVLAHYLNLQKSSANTCLDFINEPFYEIACIASPYTDEQDAETSSSQKTADFFAKQIPHAKGFLKWFLQFENNCRIVATIMRADFLQRNLQQEFTEEERDHPLIQQALQNGAKHSLPEELQAFGTIIQENSHSPMTLYKLLARWRFNQLAEAIENDYFTIDAILAYMVQRDVCECLHAMDEVQGPQIFNAIMRAQR